MSQPLFFFLRGKIFPFYLSEENYERCPVRFHNAYKVVFKKKSLSVEIISQAMVHGGRNLILNPARPIRYTQKDHRSHMQPHDGQWNHQRSGRLCAFPLFFIFSFSLNQTCVTYNIYPILEHNPRPWRPVWNTPRHWLENPYRWLVLSEHMLPRLLRRRSGFFSHSIAFIHASLLPPTIQLH